MNTPKSPRALIIHPHGQPAGGAAKLRATTNDTQQRMHTALREYKRGFIWWRPQGLAYEYTLAALGERVASLGLISANEAARGGRRRRPVARRRSAAPTRRVPT